jgi:DNA-binding beta-propeller fold protein YncE
MSRLAPILVWVGLSAFGGPLGAADDKAPAQAKPPEPVARLFVQDLKTGTLRWADVREGEGNKLTLDPLADVDAFPKLDPAKQKLVQMRESGSVVCVGVRDDADGGTQSGWVVVQTGVGYADHGDHGHWSYKKKPAVLDSKLDKEQGNPAHLYLYGGKFFVANDKLNGYTRIDPAKYATNEARPLGKDTPRFLVGGGGHITLAVADDKVGYSCWIDGGGPNKGRVDVTPVTGEGKTEPAYSFHLPHGGIHGATTNSGKVFFAPADGVCWVEVDSALKLKDEQVKVKHIDLGKEGDKPRHTGAFADCGHHVLFTAGKEKAELAILNATATDPKPVFVPLNGSKGTTALTPECVTAADKKPYAVVFHDRVKDADADDTLEVIALDPNGDGDFADAKSVKTMKVGKSAVDGHFGHHAVAFDADRRYGFFTNPADGTVSVLSVKTWQVVETFQVGGMPTAVVVRGGADHDD